MLLSLGHPKYTKNCDVFQVFCTIAPLGLDGGSTDHDRQVAVSAVFGINIFHMVDLPKVSSSLAVLYEKISLSFLRIMTWLAMAPRKPSGG